MEASGTRAAPGARQPSVSRRDLLRLSLAALAALPVGVQALDDLIIYGDAGCGDKTIEQSYAQVSGGTMTGVTSGGKVPVTCDEKHSGTDAIVMELPQNLAVGGYYDLILKFPDWGQKDLKAYKDVRFWAKNVLATDAHITLKWENAPAYQSSPIKKALVIPASSGWTEYVIPLSDFGTFTQEGLMNGFGISQPADVSKSRLHIYLDGVRVTDGTGQGSLSLPDQPGGRPPAGWTPHFLVGSYDNYQDQGYTPRLQGKVDYRYQYLTGPWKTYSGGRYVQSFVEAGKAIGLRSGFVWYHLGKAGEGGGTVKANLNDPAFMEAYFADYDLALGQMAEAGAETAILVIEPDMYGFLLQNDLVPDMDAAQMPVAMAKANALSGRAYPSTLKGYAEYMVERAKEKAPGSLVGHLLNHWGTLIPGQVGQGTLDAHLTAGAAQARFLNSLGDKGKGDIIFVEKADRDAGTKGAIWFWQKENYDKYFAWVKMISARTGLRACAWQVSQGNAAGTPANRDDAVQYFLDHGRDWAEAGFIGILFGPGDAGQADYVNDGGWYLEKMAAYRGSLLDLSGIGAAIFRPRAVPALSTPWRRAGGLLLSPDGRIFSVTGRFSRSR